MSATHRYNTRYQARTKLAAEPSTTPAGVTTILPQPTFVVPSIKLPEDCPKTREEFMTELNTLLKAVQNHASYTIERIDAVINAMTLVASYPDYINEHARLSKALYDTAIRLPQEANAHMISLNSSTQERDRVSKMLSRLDVLTTLCKIVRVHRSNM